MDSQKQFNDHSLLFAAKWYYKFIDERFERKIKKITKRLSNRFISNIDLSVCSDILSRRARRITHPRRWTTSIVALCVSRLSL